MNARIVRKIPPVKASESTLSRRVLLERLRRIIFSRARLKAETLVVALAVVAGASAAFAHTPLVFDPTADTTVETGEELTVYNDQRDFQNEENDPSKTITLDGGSFVYDAEGKGNDVTLGEGSAVKNFKWGSGGTIYVSDSDVRLFINRSGNGNNLTIGGAGEVVLTNDSEQDEHIFGNVDVYGGNLYIAKNKNLDDTKTTFSGTLYVGEGQGTASIRGDAIFYGETILDSQSELNLLNGNFEFKGDVYNSYGSSITADSTLGKGAEFSVNFDGQYTGVNKSNYIANAGASTVFNGVTLDSSAILGKKNSNLFFNEVLVCDSELCPFDKEFVGVDFGGRGWIDCQSRFKNGSSILIQDGADVEVTDDMFLDSHSRLCVSEGGTLNFGDEESNTRLQLTKEGSYATLFGDVNFKAASIDLVESTLYVGSDVKFDEESSVSLGDAGMLYGYASSAGATDVTFTQLYGEILYSNLPTVSGERPEHNFALYTENEVNRRARSLGRVRNMVDKALNDRQVVNHRIASEYEGFTSDYVMIDSCLQTTRDEYQPGQGARDDGYAVVFDSGGNDQLFTGFSGITSVGSGTAILKGETTYGNEYGIFTVSGQSYVKDDELTKKFGQNIYQAQTSGTLGFYRNNDVDATVAPTLYAYEVFFDDGAKGGRGECKLGGSRIWFDANYGDSKSDRQLGTINARGVYFGEKTQVYYDGISKAENSANLTFDLNASGVYISTYDEQTNESSCHLAAKEEIEEIFGRALLIEATYETERCGEDEYYEEFESYANLDRARVLRSYGDGDDGDYDDGDYGDGDYGDGDYGDYGDGDYDSLPKGTVTIKALNVADYAAGKNMTEKEQAVARKIDSNRLSENADSDFYDALYHETDEHRIRQVIGCTSNASIIGYQLMSIYGHFGNPTTSFFGGVYEFGERERRRTQSLDPDYPDPNNVGNQGARQSAIAQNSGYGGDRAIWGAYTNTKVDGSEYYDDGITMNGYRLKRQGVIGGLRRQIDGSTSSGLFFGLTNPELYSHGELLDCGTYGTHMEMDDFQFAAHFEKVFADFWELAVFVGGGTQSMDWSRTLSSNSGRLYRFNANGTGNTLTGTIYLANRIDLSENLTFRPMIGVDSEHSWLYGFGEDQANGGSVGDVDAYMRWLAQPYFFDQMYYNRNTARAGARVNWTGSAGYAGLNAQAFYGAQLGGKDSPILSFRSANYAFENMETHVMGGESITVGGGGFVNLNQTKTLTVTGDFNAILYKHASTQNVTGGLSYRF